MRTQDVDAAINWGALDAIDDLMVIDIDITVDAGAAEVVAPRQQDPGRAPHTKRPAATSWPKSVRRGSG